MRTSRPGPFRALLSLLPLTMIAFTADAGGTGSADAGKGDGDAGKTDATDAGGDTGKDDATADDVQPDTAGKFDAEYVAKLRTEAAGNRTKAKDLETKLAELTTTSTAQLDVIAKALGLKPADSDPAALAAKLAERDADARQARVELAVHRAAGKQSADPDALLDSRAFLAKVAELDPSKEGFDTKVSDAIKDALAANPKLKAVQAAASSSADHSGGSGEQRDRTKPKSLTDAVAADYARTG